MAIDYKSIVGSEALEREFEQLTKQARPAGGAKPGLFSAAPKPAQLDPNFIDYKNGAAHALIGVSAEKGEPQVRYFDVAENPRVSPQNVQAMAQKFIEACRKSGDWRKYFIDNKSAVMAELARWSATPADERPLNPPGSEPKSEPERIAEGKRFVEAMMKQLEQAFEHAVKPGRGEGG